MSPYVLELRLILLGHKAGERLVGLALRKKKDRQEAMRSRGRGRQAVHGFIVLAHVTRAENEFGSYHSVGTVLSLEVESGFDLSVKGVPVKSCCPPDHHQRVVDNDSSQKWNDNKMNSAPHAFN